MRSELDLMYELSAVSGIRSVIKCKFKLSLLSTVISYSTISNYNTLNFPHVLSKFRATVNI
jgi:hypothetical protein